MKRLLPLLVLIAVLSAGTINASASHSRGSFSAILGPHKVKVTRKLHVTAYCHVACRLSGIWKLQRPGKDLRFGTLVFESQFGRHFHAGHTLTRKQKDQLKSQAKHSSLKIVLRAKATESGKVEGLRKIVHFKLPPKPKKQGGGGCEPGYSPCLPVTGDLDCSDIPASKKPVYITGSDPYNLDSDGDGVGCES